MAFKVQDFRSSFNKEPASPAYYEVEVIRRPISLAFEVFDNVAERDLIYRCVSCGLPGKTMNTTERQTYGVNRRIVTSSAYQDVRFTFIISDDKSELNYFSRWQNYIVNNTLTSGVQTHDAEYYDNYIGQISIKHLDRQNEIKYRVNLLEAYPIDIEEIPLGWDTTNEFIRVTVTMAYRTYEVITGYNQEIYE